MPAPGCDAKTLTIVGLSYVHRGGEGRVPAIMLPCCLSPRSLMTHRFKGLLCACERRRGEGEALDTPSD